MDPLEICRDNAGQGGGDRVRHDVYERDVDNARVKVARRQRATCACFRPSVVFPDFALLKHDDNNRFAFCLRWRVSMRRRRFSSTRSIVLRRRVVSTVRAACKCRRCFDRSSVSSTTTRRQAKMRRRDASRANWCERRSNNNWHLKYFVFLFFIVV